MSKSSILTVVFALFLFCTACKKDTVNKLPVADAGASQTVTLPVEGVTLTGNGTDADGKVVTYLWEQVDGPAASTIVDPGAPVTVVQGLVAGTYIFQLSVFDNLGGISTDTTVITMKPGGQTLTLQPNNNPYEFAIVERSGVDMSNITVEDLETDSWTYNGGSYTLRGLLKFDLSSIPTSSTITSAHLFLYSDSTPASGDQVHANYGNNAFYVQQVAADWSTSTVGWYNQPSVLTTNQVLVPSTNLPYLDVDVDVTAQVASMVSQNANYGFFMKLQTEVIYASRQFVASHNARYPNRHPKLVVQYQ